MNKTKKKNLKKIKKGSTLESHIYILNNIYNAMYWILNERTKYCNLLPFHFEWQTLAHSKA